MATPPTLVSSGQSAWTSTTTPKTVSVTVQTNDILVIIGMSEDSPDTLSTPTGNSLTYTLQQSVVTSNFSTAYLWTAVATGNATFNVSLARSGGAGRFGLVVTVWRGSDGVGASNSNTGSGAPSLSLTTTQANSAIVYGNSDWNSVSGTSRTWRTINSFTPTAGNGGEDAYTQSSGFYTIFAAHWTDAGATGAQTTGLSAPTGQKWSAVAVEIKGAAGGTTNGTATLTGAGTVTAKATLLATASPTGAGTLSATGSNVGPTAGTATLTGVGTVTARATLRAAATVSGVGTLSATPTIISNVPAPQWRPDMVVQVAFNANPNDPSQVPAWSDLSSGPGGAFLGADMVKRGRQYELDQNRVNAPQLALLDQYEYLNPANTGSPYYGNILPYRQILWQAQWDVANGNTAVGNLLNAYYGTDSRLGTTDGYDPTFESYATSSTVPWITAVGGTSPVVGTTTPHSGSKDLTYTVATGATVQGVSFVVPCIPGRTYTVSAYVRQSSASTQRISVDGSAGSSTTTTGSYVRLTKTFTATQPTHIAQVATTGTAAAGTVLVDDLQHEQAASASTFTTSGPTIFGVFRGYVERWPSEWVEDTQGFLGVCAATCVDSFGPLNRISLNTEYHNAVMALGPDYYYPLGESAGATRYGDQSGNSGPNLANYASKYGPLVAPQPGTAMDIPGDAAGTGVTFTPESVVDGTGTIIGVGPAVNGISGLAFPPGSLAGGNSSSIALWVRCEPSLIPADAMVLALPFPTADTEQPLSLSVGSDNKLYASVGGTFDLAFVPVVVSGVGPDLTDGNPHLVVATATQTSLTTSLSAYVDGALVGTASDTTSSVGGLLAIHAYNLIVGGFFAYTAYQQIINGTISNVALWGRALSAGEVAGLQDAGQGYPGETSGARIARYLSYGWNGLTSIATGDSTMGVSSLSAGTQELAACQDVTTTENGNFWADRNGVTTFTARSARYYNLTARWVFGEDEASGEYPYQEGIEFDFDPTFLYNTVTVNNADGVTVTVSDQASIQQFFEGTTSLDVNTTDNQALDQANWILATHKQPAQRVASIMLNPAANPDLWPVVLGIEINDRVTVKRRPKAANAGAGFVMSQDYFVESISHDRISMADATWLTTLLLSPAPPVQPGILDDPVLGLLDTTMVLAF